MKTIKKHYFILFLMLLICSYSFAQSPGAALASYSSGKLDDAKDKIEKALANEKHAAKAKTWFIRGLIYGGIAGDQTGLFAKTEKEPLTKAIESFAKAKEIDPKVKVTANGQTMNSDDAKLNLSNIAINYGVGKYNEKDLPAAIDAFVVAYKMNKKDTLGCHYASQLSYDEEKFDIFEDAVATALASDMKNKILHYARYVFYLRDVKKDKEKALEVAEKALEEDKALDPQNYQLIENVLVQLYIELDKIDEAIAGINKNIKADPDNVTYYYNLGVLYEKKENREKALQSYEKSIELDPENFDARYNAGALFFNEGAKITQEVNAMKLDEYNEKGKPLEKKAAEQFEKALPFFEKLYSMKPNEMKILGPLSNIYRALKMKDKEKEVQARIKVLVGEDE